MRQEKLSSGAYTDVQIVSQPTAEVLRIVAGEPDFLERVTVLSWLPAEEDVRRRPDRQVDVAQRYGAYAVRAMGRQALDEEAYYNAALRQIKSGMDIIQIAVGPNFAGPDTVKSFWAAVTERQTVYVRRTQTRSPLIGS